MAPSRGAAHVGPGRGAHPGPPLRHPSQPAGVDIDTVVALGLRGRYHGAVRRLAALCDVALTAGLPDVEAIDTAVGAALERSLVEGADRHKVAQLRSLTSGHLVAARRRAALRAIAPSWYAPGERLSGAQHHPAPLAVRRRPPARRSGGLAAITVDAG